MKKKRNIAFIVELLLLFIILLFVIVVITQTFMKSRSQSLYARHLTEAVSLAESVAEVSMAASGRDEAVSMLGEMEQVQSVSDAGEIIGLEMKFAPEGGRTDHYRAEIRRTEEDAFVTEEILVFFADETEPIYSLETGNYLK
ncbi:MAG: hypothetical protein IJ860_07620 [Eubacterium sp.]|nr:hypothetical protein [Eubacterium sp.]